MPQIKEYRSQVETGGPINVRRMDPNDFSGVAQGFQSLGQGLENIQERITKNKEDSEISSINAELAKYKASKSNELSESLKKADPNDSTFYQKFMDGVEKDSSSIGNLATTERSRNYFNSSYAHVKAGFMEASFQAQAELAAVKAVSDSKDTMNALSSDVRSNPANLDQNMKLFQDRVSLMASKVGPEKAMEFRTAGEQELVKSSIRGWIDLNPEGAKKKLNEGTWNDKISGSMKDQLLGEADQAIRARFVENERIKAAEKEALEKRQKVTQNEFLKKLDTNSLTTKEILDSNLEPIGSGSKDTFLDMIRAKAKGGQTTDPKTYTDLFKRIHAPYGDPEKITNDSDLNEYFINGKLSDTDLKFLRLEMEDKGTDEGEAKSTLKKQLFDTARTLLVRPDFLGIKDPKGEVQLAKFQSAFFAKQKEYAKQGKDPMELLEANNPNWFGNTLRSYQKSMDEVIEDGTERMNIEARTPVPLEDISKMSKAELIDFNKRSLTQEQIDAAKARWNELTAEEKKAK